MRWSFGTHMEKQLNIGFGSLLLKLQNRALALREEVLYDCSSRYISSSRTLLIEQYHILSVCKEVKVKKKVLLSVYPICPTHCLSHI